MVRTPRTEPRLNRKSSVTPLRQGANWTFKYTLYDQSALGRFDGECYNIGFLDVWNRPCDELGNAAIASHESMYQVADGQTVPFNDAPEYFPLLFLQFRGKISRGPGVPDLRQWKGGI